MIGSNLYGDNENLTIQIRSLDASLSRTISLCQFWTIQIITHWLFATFRLVCWWTCCLATVQDDSTGTNTLQPLSVQTQDSRSIPHVTTEVSPSPKYHCQHLRSTRSRRSNYLRCFRQTKACSQIYRQCRNHCRNGELLQGRRHCPPGLH